MKILLSVYACDPTRGGEFGNGWCYADNSSSRREIWCLTTTEGKAAIDALLAREARPWLHMEYVEVPGWLLMLKLKSPQVGVYFHYFYWQYRAYRHARKLATRIPFDVVHHATYASLQLGSFLWRLHRPMMFGPVGGGQKAPIAFKEYFYKWWKLEQLRDGIEYLLMNVLRSATKVLSHADLVLVVNEDTYQLARKHNARRIVYAPCTLLPDKFGPEVMPVRTLSRELRVLWVGRLLARKGLRLVLEAISRVDPAIPIKLTIIGDGALGTHLPAWFSELNIANRVEWLGRQPLDVVKQAYLQHDVFVYCSLRESLAAQFFESMSFGLPMIIFDLHGATTFVPHDVAIKIPVTTPDETVNEIKNALERMQRYPEQRHAMGVAAFVVARSFFRSKRLESINRQYDELAARGRDASVTNGIVREQATKYV